MKTIIIILVAVLMYLSSATGQTEPIYQDLSRSYRISAMPERLCHSTDVDESRWSTNLLALPPGGEYCLRVHFNLEEGDIPGNPAILWSALASANIYWDGQYLASNGVPGTSAATESPGNIHFYYPVTHLPQLTGEHTLSIWMSNHHLQQELHQNIYQLALVNIAAMERQSLFSYLPSVFLSGGLFLIAVVLALIYLFYLRQASTLWFMVISFSCSALLMAEKWREIFGYEYPFHIIRLNIVLALSLILAISLPSYYLSAHRLKRAHLWGLGIAALMVATILAPASYDTKVWVVFLIAIVSSLVISTVATLSRKLGAVASTIYLTFTLFFLVILKVSFVEHWFALAFGSLIIFNLFHMVRQFASDRKKSLMATKLEAELLRRSLQPHFLMNSLTLITEWIETDPPKATAFIQGLSTEFKLLTRYSKSMLIDIREEINLCHNYLRIMSARLQKDYQLKVEGLGRTDGDIKIPPAVIHTLIENAFSHGSHNATNPFLLTIEHKDRRHVNIELTTPLGTGDHDGAGVGTQYIESQLARAFGNSWQLLQSSRCGNWVVTLRFKCR